MDRRHQFRKVLDKFAFLQIERDDGGTVLDVSEGGLRFETFAPVLQEGPVHCWFSLNLRERIEAWGEVVWANKEKKYGGLRFLQVSEKGRGLIREWISQPTLRPIADEEYERGVVVGRADRIGVSEPDAVARFVAKARPRQGTSSNGHAIPRTRQAPAANPPTASGHTVLRAWEAPPENPLARPPLPSFASAAVAGHTSTLFPTAQDEKASGELVPLQRYLSATRRQLRIGLILGACISAAVAAAAIEYSDYHHENTRRGNAQAELLVQKSPEATAKPAPMNPSASSGMPADIHGSIDQKIRVAEARTPILLPAETGGHSGPSPRVREVSSPPVRATLRPSLTSNAGRQKPAVTAQQLWASVQAGNTKAAVELADLYIKGQGVPQNCNQARVLLLVASEKRNPEAIKKLADLDKTGCPSN